MIEERKDFEESPPELPCASLTSARICHFIFILEKYAPWYTLQTTLKKKNHYSFINNYLLAYSNVKKPRVALIFKIFLYAGIIRNICSDWLITVHDCVFYLDTLLPHWQCIWRHDHAEKGSCRQSGAFQMKLHGG